MNYAKLGTLAFAAVSVKAAIDFDRAFTQIAAITNTAQSDIEGLKQTVLDLSEETAVAPTELAHAMYFLASAGLDADQQMSALDATARGVAVGLGSAGDLARITANALNVFADNGLSATDVMDTLTAAVREGTAEPDEFAGALGRVLPIADQAGISFQAVAASLASMSNAGLDVNEGVTALRAILQSLVAPTAQTESAFNRMGLSVDEVVASMQHNGLIATLRLLRANAKDVTNGVGAFNQLMRHAIPNIRGLAGAFNLLKQNGDKIDAIFQAVNRSAGALNRAFEITSQSDAFKVSQALNQISVAGQKLAADVLPAVATALQYVSGAADDLATNVSESLHPKDFEDFSNSYLNAVSFPFQALAQEAQQIPVLGDLIPDFPTFDTAASEASIKAGVDQIHLIIASSGLDIAKQAQIYDDALASVGGTIDADNIDEFSNSVRTAIGEMKLQDQVAQNNAKSMSQAASSTKYFAYENALAATALQDLSYLGQDAVGYLADLHQTLQDSDEPTKDFATAVGDLTSKWNDFHQQAVEALNFAPQALSDLTEAAQSARDQLADLQAPDVHASKSEIKDYNAQLSELGSTANLTGEEILNAFQASSAKTVQFGHDLMDIAKVGGSAGKALAASLLESGDVLGAQLIADQPAKLQKQITNAFGKGADMADTLATKLTNSIVGPLNSIVHILTALAENVWKIDVNGDGVIGLQKQVDKAKHKADGFANKKYFVHMALKDDASPGIKTIKDDTTHLVANAHKLQFQVNQEHVERQLSTMESNLDRLTSRKYTVNVGVHTGPKSPWPDEALKMHLTDPMKDTGFKRVGDTWTLPLSVGAHTDVGAPTNDPTTFPGGKGTRGDKKVPGLDALREIEKRQLQVLFDIRRELKNGGSGGGAGGSVAGGGTGTGGGGRGGPHGSLHEISPLKAAAAEIVRMTSKSGATLTEGLGVVQRIAAQGLNPAFMRHAVEGVRQELGKGAARQYQQQLRLIDQMTKDDAEKRAIARRAAYYAAHPDAHRASIDQQRFMTPLQRSVESIFQKVYKAGVTPGEARGMIARVAREGRDPKFIGGAIKDIAKELGPRAAREFGHSLRGLDASTARNAKHQQAALDAARDAFKQMTQHAKQQAVQDTKQQQAREEARKQWMADTLAYATHNVPRLPRGHTNISVNHHERHKKHEVRLDRKRFTDSAAYEVDYARGF